jgi:hypothetical protein
MTGNEEGYGKKEREDGGGKEEGREREGRTVRGRRTVTKPLARRIRTLRSLPQPAVSTKSNAHFVQNGQDKKRENKLRMTSRVSENFRLLHNEELCDSCR